MKNAKYFFVALVPAVVMLAMQFMVMFALMIVYGVVGVVSGQITSDGIGEYIMSMMSGPDYTSTFMLCFEIIAAVAFGVVFLTTCPANEKKSIKQAPFYSIPKGILIFMGGELLTSCALMLLGEVAPGIMEDYADSIAATLGDMNWKIMLASLLLAPIAEELIFRGVTMRSALKATKSFWAANVLQALLFGLVHMNLVQGTYAFCLGLLLGYIRRRYNSLLASIWGHVVFNFTGTIIVGIVFGIETDKPWLYIGLIAVLSLLLLVGGIFWVQKDKRSKSDTEQFDNNHKLSYDMVKLGNVVPAMPTGEQTQE